VLTLAFVPVNRAIPGVSLGPRTRGASHLAGRESQGSRVCPSYALAVAVEARVLGLSLSASAHLVQVLGRGHPLTG